jgi:dihydroxyacetone kinase-like protein
MGKTQLDLQQIKEMFVFIAKKMIESKDILTNADQAIGDGDHGIGMARGFEAVRQKLIESEFNTLGELLKAIGMSLLSSIGGAAGAIFGTFFKGSAKNLDDYAVLNSESLSMMLLDGLLAVKVRGKAEPGDKTMVDALEPAASKARRLIDQPLDLALAEISEEANKGMEKTKNMIATIGKSKTLGERSLGYPDPGAISISLILKYMSEFVKD